MAYVLLGIHLRLQHLGHRPGHGAASVRPLGGPRARRGNARRRGHAERDRRRRHLRRRRRALADLRLLLLRHLHPAAGPGLGSSAAGRRPRIAHRPPAPVRGGRRRRGVHHAPAPGGPVRALRLLRFPVQQLQRAGGCGGLHHRALPGFPRPRHDGPRGAAGLDRHEDAGKPPVRRRHRLACAGAQFSPHPGRSGRQRRALHGPPRPLRCGSHRSTSSSSGGCSSTPRAGRWYRPSRSPGGSGRSCGSPQPLSGTVAGASGSTPDSTDLVESVPLELESDSDDRSTAARPPSASGGRTIWTWMQWFSVRGTGPAVPQPCRSAGSTSTASPGAAPREA